MDDPADEASIPFGTGLPQDEWEHLHWWRLPVCLKNVRNEYAKEHPVYVMRAILLYALHGVPSEMKCEHRFQFRHAPGDRVRKHATYRIDWVFPRAREEQVMAHAEALRRYLGNDGGRNFLLESCGPAQRLTLHQLRRSRPLPMEAEEICLDFFTPMAFSAEDKKRPWMLTPEKLHDYLLSSIQWAAGELPVPALPPVPEGLSLLCWFWHFQSHRHTPRSKEGSRTEILGGMSGPLYLRGPWQLWEPWLRLAAEFGIGKRGSLGQGACGLLPHRSFFDRELGRATRYTAAWDEYEEGTDRAESLVHAMADKDKLCDAWSREISQGLWTPEPATEFTIPKKDGSERRICLLPDRDAIIHRALNHLLSPVLDRALEQCSIAYRKDRSTEDARKSVAAALEEGCDHVVESDIADYFDTIPWPYLDEALDRLLPRPDVMTRTTLQKIIQTPVERAGMKLERDTGILQGSPLSPLLANLFLDPLDEEITAWGWRFIRHRDDFIILVRSEETAGKATAYLHKYLARLGMHVPQGKITIRPVLHGFRFLGMQLGGELGEHYLEATALRRPLVISTPHCSAGLDHDCLLLRKDGEILDCVPLDHIRQIIFHGAVSLSSRLIEMCSRRRIPLLLCDAQGNPRHSISPERSQQMTSHTRHHGA